MNAKPTDVSTPYMDIIERTGSGPYDLQMKTRIGDLSGLSSGYLYGNEEPGFGIYTDNGFFRGTLTAETGSFKGIVHIATDSSDMKFGISASKDSGHSLGKGKHGIHINDHNYLYNDGFYKLGTSNQYIEGSGSVKIFSSGFNLNTDGTVTASAGKIAGWDITSGNINKNHVFLDSDNQSFIVKNQTDEKNIIRVGSASMSPVTGNADELENPSFESSTTQQQTGSIHSWNSRMSASQPFNFDTGVNIYLQQWITGSDPAHGSQHYSIILRKP